MNRNANHSMSAGQIIGTMNGLQVFGLDIAKQIFQLHSVDMQTGEIVNVAITRAKMLERFANQVPVIGRVNSPSWGTPCASYMPRSCAPL
jgi:transposase